MSYILGLSKYTVAGQENIQVSALYSNSYNKHYVYLQGIINDIIRNFIIIQAYTAQYNYTKLTNNFCHTNKTHLQIIACSSDFQEVMLIYTIFWHWNFLCTLHVTETAAIQ